MLIGSFKPTAQQYPTQPLPPIERKIRFSAALPRHPEGDVVSFSDVNIGNLCRDILAPLPGSVTTVERVNMVDQLAYKLFTTCRDKASLLTVLQKLNVDVLDSTQSPWIEDLFVTIGAAAMVFIPTSISHPGQPRENIPTIIGPIPPEYELYAEAMEQKQQLGILIGKDASLGCLMHEIYHILQLKKGLLFNTANLQIDHQAQEALIKLEEQISGSPWQKVKMGLLGQWAQLKFNLGLLQEKPNSLGHSIRQLLTREMENYRFFNRYRKELNLGPEFNRLNDQNLSLYRLIYPYTYRWDQ